MSVAGHLTDYWRVRCRPGADSLDQSICVPLKVRREGWGVARTRAVAGKLELPLRYNENQNLKNKSKTFERYQPRCGQHMGRGVIWRLLVSLSKVDYLSQNAAPFQFMADEIDQERKRLGVIRQTQILTNDVMHLETVKTGQAGCVR